MCTGLSEMKRKILTKRVYESPSHDDGMRILVDHIWPRGLSKTAAALDLWIKEVAPSSQLRKWFDHRPERWLEFKRRYDVELDNNQTAVTQFTTFLLSDEAQVILATEGLGAAIDGIDAKIPEDLRPLVLSKEMGTSDWRREKELLQLAKDTFK